MNSRRTRMQSELSIIKSEEEVLMEVDCDTNYFIDWLF